MLSSSLLFLFPLCIFQLKPIYDDIPYQVAVWYYDKLVKRVSLEHVRIRTYAGDVSFLSETVNAQVRWLMCL